ncbi:MAG TPA: tetratricopeptide repeat protein [Thermoanaerobaculaceae bacterium]|nr:tetratricopeptide repeat protein [Thermoanaerobaculaceae bacterium]
MRRGATSPRRVDTRLVVLGVLAVIVAAIAPYLGALGNDFVWDDLNLIVHDDELGSSHGVWHRLGQDFFAAGRDPSAAGYWRPLITLSFALDRAVWGLRPWGYHLTSLLLHAACAVLAVLLVRTITSTLWPALATGVLFALHPMHVENVVFVSGRTDLVAALMGGLAMLSHLVGSRRADSPQRVEMHRGRWLQAMAVVLFALALLAKEMAVVMIAWLAVIHLVVERRGWRQSAALVTPLVLVTAAYLTVRLLVLGIGLPEPGSVRLSQVLMTLPATLARYLSWLVLPTSLHGFVQNPPVSSLASIRVVLGLVVMAAAAGGLAVTWKRSRPMFAMGAMSLLALAPLFHVAPIKSPPDMGLVMAERFLYFPSLPFLALLALLAASVGELLSARVRRVLGVAVTLVVVAWWSAMIVGRIPDWHDDVSFFTAALRDAPDSPTVVANLANAYVERADFTRAAAVLNNAPEVVRQEQPVRLAQAQVLAAQGRFPDAMAVMESVVSTRWPGDQRARNNLACLYRMTGKLAEALAMLEELIREGNELPETHVNTVEAYRARGDLPQAIEACRRGLARFPQDPSLQVLCRGAWAAR